MNTESYNLVSDIWKVKVVKENFTFPVGNRVYCFSIVSENVNLVISTDYNNKWMVYTRDEAKHIFEYIYDSPLWGRKRVQFLAMFNRNNANALNNKKIIIKYSTKKGAIKVG